MVDLSDGLNLVPLVSNKVRPPDAHRGGHRGGRGLVGAHWLARGQKYTSRPLPVDEEDIDGALMPQHIEDVQQLRNKIKMKFSDDDNINFTNLLTLNSKATPSKTLNASSSAPIGRAKKRVVWA